jgi:hypothetical protein
VPPGIKTSKAMGPDIDRAWRRGWLRTLVLAAAATGSGCEVHHEAGWVSGDLGMYPVAILALGAVAGVAALVVYALVRLVRRRRPGQ